MFSIPYEVRKIDLQTAKGIAYIDEGKGTKTILFIHGLASYGWSWRKNIEQLKQHYRCIAIDLPGNGFSARSDEYPYSISFFAGVIREFITALKLKDLCIAGHSMGGQIAITALLNNPALAEKIVLCAPAGFETFTTFESSIYQATFHFFDFFSSEKNSLEKSIKGSFYHYTAQADEMVSDLQHILDHYPIKEYRRMIESSIRAMLNEPVFSRLKEIRQDALVIFGERDALIPNRMIHPVNTRKIAEDGTRQMAGAKLELISQCGHFVQWEKAEEVNRHIHHFMQS